MYKINKLLSVAAVTLTVAACGSATQNLNDSSLEGFYTLSNGGYADIYEDAQGLVTVRAMRVVLSNADGSSAALPIAAIPQTPKVAGVLYSTSSTATYVPTTNNVKKDSDGTAISGVALTQLRISKSKGVLTIQVLISSSSGLLFNHSVQSQ